MIYLDNNATTELYPEVKEEMLSFLSDIKFNFGNPSSPHKLGKKARDIIESSRNKVSSLINANPEEIIFTSGGTESNNLALYSLTHAHTSTEKEKGTIITSKLEHNSVYEPVEFYQKQGWKAKFIQSDEFGNLNFKEWKEAIKEAKESNLSNSHVATLMWVNNETGVITPMEKFLPQTLDLTSRLCIPFHIDATQAIGKFKIDVQSMPVHSLSLSSHKFHGPTGVGALYINRYSKFDFHPLGGKQEKEIRGGTHNVLGILGMGKAAEITEKNISNTQKIGKLRNFFESTICKEIPKVTINGDIENRVSNTSNLYFEGVDSEGLLILLNNSNIYCSSGSACSSDLTESKPNRIIKEMTNNSERAQGSVRFSLSHFSTEEEIITAIQKIKIAINKLRTI